MTQLADLDPEAFPLAHGRPRRHPPAQPARPEEPAHLRQLCRASRHVPRIRDADDVDAVVFASNGGNFCSGGDVHDIIGPLVGMDMKQLLAFTG